MEETEKITKIKMALIQQEHTDKKVFSFV